MQAVEPTIEIPSVLSFSRLPDQIMSLEDNLRHAKMMMCQPSFLAAVRRNWKGNNRCKVTTSVLCSHLHYCRHSDFHALYINFSILHRKVASLMLSREVNQFHSHSDAKFSSISNSESICQLKLLKSLPPLE